MLLRKFLTLIFVLILSTSVAVSMSIEEGKKAFDQYVNYGNSCDQKLSDMYDKNTIIKRLVKQPDGTTSERTLSVDMYKTMLKYYGKVALWRGYKNTYSNIRYQKKGSNIVVYSMRHPSTSDTAFKAKIVFGKNEFGRVVIVEEIFHTKASFLIK